MGFTLRARYRIGRIIGSLAADDLMARIPDPKHPVVVLATERIEELRARKSGVSIAIEALKVTRSAGHTPTKSRRCSTSCPTCESPENRQRRAACGHLQRSRDGQLRQGKPAARSGERSRVLEVAGRDSNPHLRLMSDGPPSQCGTGSAQICPQLSPRGLSAQSARSRNLHCAGTSRRVSEGLEPPTAGPQPAPMLMRRPACPGGCRSGHPARTIRYESISPESAPDAIQPPSSSSKALSGTSIDTS
jgi:hypothetical protein